MAIYHLTSGFISRSSGRSSVQNAAYITGEQLHESRRNIDVNYQNRSHDVAFSSTLIPEHAPSDLANSTIWDKVESFEDEYARIRFPNGDVAREKYMNSAQTAMTMIVALPKEISLDSSKELVEDFLTERFLSRGLIATYAIHENSGNPHAHFLISRRSIDEKGEFSWLKDRAICTKRELLKTRTLWADKTNFYLEREGLDVQISEKSFLDLGVDLRPTKHHGWYADKLISEGESSRIISENEKVYIDNKQKIEVTPTVILDEITSKQATFSQRDLLKTIQKRIGDDVEMVSYVFETCLKNAVYIGDHIDGDRRYTSQTYQKTEESALLVLSDLKEKAFAHKVQNDDVLKTVETHYTYLSPEQKNAVIGLLKEDVLSVLIGRAGSGKTTTLRAVSECYQQAGFNVIGCSLSAVASENLGNEAGIPSSTLHSLLYKLDALKDAENQFLSFNSIMEEGLFKQLDWYQDLKRYEGAKLSDKSVIIVDEAGMVGTKLWQSLLTHAKEAGAKIIAVGDDNQFKPVDAGDFFRCIKEVFKDSLFELNTIRRQKEDWMKQASVSFSKLNVQEGLTAYHNKGFVHEADKNMIERDIAKDYLNFIKQGKDVAVLASTNQETRTLNEEIRSILKQENGLDKETILTLGEKTFNRGEKIVFLKNDKIKVSITNQDGEKIEGAFIKNGMVGTLLKTDDNGNAMVLLKDKTLAHFNINTYNTIDYGYALTTHKSQGQTVDVTLVKANKMLESKALYVAMTRHKEEAHLYYSTSDFKSFNHLKMSLSSYKNKDLIKDYTIQNQDEKAWERVQNYKLCGLDLAHMKATKEEIDPKAYQAIRAEQISLGKEILKDFDNHKTFINQSGFTKEMIEITAGLKQRPLSLLEEQAKLRVQLYGQTAESACTLWKDLKGKDLNHNKEQYAEFKTMRDERNSLAKDILDNYRLHAQFVKAHQQEYLISKKILMKHKDSQKTSTVDNAHQNTLKTKDLRIDKGLHNTQKEYIKNLTPYSKTSHEIVDELNSNIKDIATHFLGKPTSQTSREWRYGKKGSLSIQIAGQKQGLYSNFETGESGNIVHFIAEQLGVDKKEAFKWGVEYLGVGSKPIQREPVQKDQPLNSKHLTLNSQNWIPTYPITVPYPDLKSEKQLSYMLKGRHEVAKFEYKDAEGKTLGYVVRLEDKEGNKITPTLTYCQNDKGQKQWMFKGFGNDRPLYGLDILKQKPTAPVLIVEGEKTCEAARLIFKDHAVITWSSGCGAVQKSDWSPLKDRDVTIWPDHDKAGKQAANKIAAILNEKEAKSITLIDLPSTLPHKWDLADKLPDEFTHQGLMNNKTVLLNITSSSKTYTEKQQKERSSHCISYLLHEVEKSQKDWMKNDQAKTFLKIIEERPFEALKAWQSRMNDFSFKPLTDNEFTTFKEQLSDLLNEKAVSLEMIDDLQKINPNHVTQALNQVYKSLKIEGNIDSGMTSEKASKILEDQRKDHIIAYIKEEIDFEKQNGLENDKVKTFVKNLEDKPFEMLKIWQDQTGDHSFKPLTTIEMEKILDQIYEKMIENNLSKNDLSTIISHTNSYHLEDILKNVKPTITHHKSQRSIDTQQTKNLIKQYEIYHHDPEKQKKISSKSNNITKNHQPDDHTQKVQKHLQNTMNKQLER